MSVEYSYNNWAKSYDQVSNKTRDLEGIALREILTKFNFKNALEIGCGTGKNTEYLLNICKKITAVDLSIEMLSKAKSKIKSEKVTFIKSDISNDWHFGVNPKFDLICFSLVLEHIEILAPLFKKANDNLEIGGYIYIGELHPFKQYNGTKARFETENGTEIVDCYLHNISDFINCALDFDLKIVHFEEYFDDNNALEIPRILAILFQKT